MPTNHNTPPPSSQVPQSPADYDARMPQEPKKPGKGWIVALAVVVAVAALIFALPHLIPGGEPSPEQTVGTTESQTTATEHPTDPPGNWEDNVLMAAPEGIEDMYSYEHIVLPVFGSDITRQEIGTVTFLSTLADAPDDAWDVSADGSGSVLAWAIPNGDLYDLYIAGSGGVNGAVACRGLFAGYRNATSIDFGDSFHTDYAADMRSMFEDCRSLTTLELSNFNTEKVGTMEWMFAACSELTELNLSNFNTENVIGMTGMFNSCSKLTNLVLSSFNTEKVTDMGWMFAFCSSLTELNLNSFNTEKVWDMRWMFKDCPGVTVDDVAHFDTTNVKYYESFMDGTGWEHLFS